MSSVPHSTAQLSPALPALPQKPMSLGRSNPTTFSSTSSSACQVTGRVYNEETEAVIQLREDSDAMNEIIVSIDMKDRGTIGCAYYIAREEKLCLMKDIKMAGLDIVDTLMLYIEPTVVLISTRSEEKLEEHLNKSARGIDQADDASTFVAPFYCIALLISVQMIYMVMFLIAVRRPNSTTKLPRTN
jgi:DNA mismatch repair protein MSH5